MLFMLSTFWAARAERSGRINREVADLLKRVSLKKMKKCKLQKPRKVKKHISKATF